MEYIYYFKLWDAERKSNKNVNLLQSNLAIYKEETKPNPRGPQEAVCVLIRPAGSPSLLLSLWPQPHGYLSTAPWIYVHYITLPLLSRFSNSLC